MIDRRSRLAALALICLTACLAGPVLAGERSCPDDAVIFDAEEGMTEPEVLEKVNPRYPEEARKEKVQGTVILDLVIDTQGEVVGATALEDPDARLTEAAVEAVKQWRFEPAKDSSGTPIEVCYEVTISFKLK